MHDTDTGTATVTRRLPPIALPVNATEWRRHFEKHFQEGREAQLAYDTARVCKIEFTAEELGAFAVCCERELTPLRWAVRRDGHGHVARLLDDSGDPNPPEVLRIAFETPCVEEGLPHAPRYDVPNAGGLYVARRGGVMAAIIIPPSVRRLPDFRCFPHIHGGVRSTDSVLCFLTIARLWAGARLSGDLVSAVRRRDVLRALTLHIFRLVGGKDWALAEESANTRGNRLTDLKRAVSKKREEAAVGAAIALDCAMLAATTCKKRVERMASLATSFQLLPPAPSQRIEMGRNVILRRIAGSANWISELALRLASDPGNVQAWAGDRLSAGLTRLLEATTFARAARFLVLATDRHLQSRAAPGQLYAGWEWT